MVQQSHHKYSPATLSQRTGDAIAGNECFLGTMTDFEGILEQG
jgi:hypothetical protein